MERRNPYRFRRSDRLTDAVAYSRVFKRARRSRDRFFTVLCRPADDRARLGLAISKKHCRKASERNRLKRVVRESFRLHKEALAGLDIVVMNQPAAAQTGNRELFRSLETHWRHCRAQNAGKTN